MHSPAVDRAWSDEHVCLMICEAHCNTWYTFEGLMTAVLYMRGVAAGTPLANVLFLIGATVCFGLIGQTFLATQIDLLLTLAARPNFGTVRVVMLLVMAGGFRCRKST